MACCRCCRPWRRSTARLFSRRRWRSEAWWRSCSSRAWPPPRSARCCSPCSRSTASSSRSSGSPSRCTPSGPAEAARSTPPSRPGDTEGKSRDRARPSADHLPQDEPPRRVADQLGDVAQRLDRLAGRDGAGGVVPAQHRRHDDGGDGRAQEGSGEREREEGLRRAHALTRRPSPSGRPRNRARAHAARDDRRSTRSSADAAAARRRDGGTRRGAVPGRASPRRGARGGRSRGTRRRRACRAIRHGGDELKRLSPRLLFPRVVRDDRPDPAPRRARRARRSHRAGARARGLSRRGGHPAAGPGVRRRPLERLPLRRRHLEPARGADGRRHLPPRSRRGRDRARRPALGVDDPDRVDHPGADMVLKADADKTHLLGGTIRALPQPPHPAFGRYLRTPREVRALLRAKGWNRAVAFQTRNPLHRAHEYALVYALETLLRAGYNAGAALMPLVGETKEDDVRAEVRMRTYEALLETRALGDGDSDPALWGPRGESVPDRVILLGLDIKMFYGGPKEAVMHAIYRQNFGFTDLVVGRRHADAPYHDGTSIWGDFDAQEIFGQLRGALGIQPLKVGFAAYYESVGRVDLMDLHPDEKPVFISGRDVRRALLEGREVDPRIMRPSTARILAAAMRG